MSKKRPRPNHIENAMARALDELAEFEEYTEGILPLLRKAVKEGWTPEQIEKHPKVQAMLIARQISIALKDKDSSKALAAIKDARDRSQGKAVDKIETTHKLEKLPDEQLNAKLKSLLGDAPYLAASGSSTDEEDDDDSITH